MEALVTWSATCPSWQRDALRRLCERGSELDQADLDALLAICRGDGTARALASEHVRDSKAAMSTVTLRALRDVHDVNALAPNERLSFDKVGLTVVYGHNGAGKSGYARVLKSACRARSHSRDETILANIYGAPMGTPAAVIDIAIDGQNTSATWVSGQVSDPLLSAVSVFDSRTASVHVGQANDVAYTPAPLRLLAALAEVCKEIKKRLSADIVTLKKQAPATVTSPACNAITTVGKLIRHLDAQTDTVTVEQLAALTETDKARLRQLEGDLAADPARAAARLGALVTKIRSFADRLDVLFAATSENSEELLRERAAALRTARAAASTASATLFADEPLPNIGSDVWRALWKSARTFSEREAYPSRDFPPTEDAVCVLCQQVLDSEAAARMRSFEAFMKDDSQAREEAAARTYEEDRQKLAAAAFGVRDLVGMVACVRDELEDDVLASRVRRVGLLALWRHRHIMRHHNAEPVVPLPASEEPPSGELRARAAEVTDRAVGIGAEAGSEERRALIAERDELAARFWLQGIKADILAEIRRRKEIAALEKACQDTSTNRITTKSTEIAQRLVTDALRAQFAKEVARLEAGEVAVELRQKPSAIGIPRFQVALIRKPDTGVAEVLSEGEHRCVALAAFLAELATTDSRSAIVLDDPVCSLDHRHREAIARRLAEEGQHRQVIIFTHDLPFLFLLDEACREQQPMTHMAMRCISRGSSHAGHCSEDAPLRARPLYKVIQAMEARLAKERRLHERGDQPAWEDTVRSLQRDLRDAWERAVEEAVAPVLKRLSNKVDTKGLAKLTAITLEDCTTMRIAYGRCSELIHSEAAEFNSPLPHPEKVQDEVIALKTWYTSIRDRQKGVK